jgi:hypothetical protein
MLSLAVLKRDGLVELTFAPHHGEPTFTATINERALPLLIEGLSRLVRKDRGVERFTLRRYAHQEGVT